MASNPMNSDRFIIESHNVTTSANPNVSPFTNYGSTGDISKDGYEIISACFKGASTDVNGITIGWQGTGINVHTNKAGTFEVIVVYQKL